MEDLQSSLCKDVFIKAEGEVVVVHSSLCKDVFVKAKEEVVVVHSLVLVQEQRLADIAVQLEML